MQCAVDKDWVDHRQGAIKEISSQLRLPLHQLKLVWGKNHHSKLPIEAAYRIDFLSIYKGLSASGVENERKGPLALAVLNLSLNGTQLRVRG